MTSTPRLATRPCELAPELFHAPDGERHNSAGYHDRVADARKLCSYCPALMACRQLGRELRETGIWGGETEHERRAAGYPPRNSHTANLAPCGTPAGARRHRRHGHKPCNACLRAETAAKREREARRLPAAA